MGFFQDLRTVEQRSDAQKAQHVGVNGREGTATITAVRRTGAYVDVDPEIEMDLRVTVDGMSPYTTTHRQVVSTAAGPQFQRGAIIPVKVDPADPTSLIVA